MTPWLTAGGRLPVTGAKQVGPILSKAGASQSKGTVSLAKARQLPQYKGKSDARPPPQRPLVMRLGREC